MYQTKCKSSIKPNGVLQTLRLLLSSAVPRIKVISGKILGGCIAAVLPVATLFILTSMYLAVTGGLGWGLNQWTSLLIISMISIIYVVLFYCIGTFLSSVILDQTLSCFSCFAVWIMFVLVIPTISPYIAKAAIKIPDAATVQREINYIMNVEREEAIRNAMRPFLDQGMSREEAWDKAELSKLNIQYFEKVSAMETNLRTASIRQARFHPPCRMSFCSLAISYCRCFSFCSRLIQRGLCYRIVKIYSFNKFIYYATLCYEYQYSQKFPQY